MATFQSGDPKPRIRTVLIVDDEADIRESLSSMLVTSLPNLRCMFATGGEDALHMLRGERVDLILSDYKMPGMDGLEFLRLARKQAPHVPRMMLTAYPDLEVAVRAINEGGIETFLTKPLDPVKIIQLVTESLAASQAKQDRDLALARALGVGGKG